MEDIKKFKGFIDNKTMDTKELHTAREIYDSFYKECTSNEIQNTIKEKYDECYKFIDGPGYVCELNGKKGLVDNKGIEIIPCEQDEIYEMMDTDGVIPYIKDCKWGLCHFGVCTGAIFDDIEIYSEEFCQALFEGEWGWIDSNGKFTRNVEEAWFGSWYDCEK